MASRLGQFLWLESHDIIEIQRDHCSVWTITLLLRHP